MTLLAIDTSSAYASVALFDGGSVLAEKTWHARRRHDDHLFPAIDELLSLAEVPRTKLTRVAVATGPGSFTGLRLGIAAAEGMARASGAALVAVATSDAIAHPFAAPGRRVCVLIDAGRGEHYSVMYRMRRGTWSRTSEIAIQDIEGIARTIALETVFAGDVDAATAAALRARLGRRAVVPSPSVLTRRAGHLAEIAWERAERGETVRPGALEPLYVRPPTIRGPAGELVAPSEPAVASAPRPGH